MRVRRCFTGTAEGDLAVTVDPRQLERRRRQVAHGPWTWLQQVHGAEVLTVGSPGEGAGASADAVVTDVPGAVLAVHTADCAPVLLEGRGDGTVVIGAAHAGWRGLRDGVLPATVAAMRALGAEGVTWWLGPCISPAAYEFGEADLDHLVEHLGPSVRSVTNRGTPAFDLRAGVRASLADSGVVEARPGAEPPCTVLDPGWYSWRRDRTPSRQAAVIWIDDGADTGQHRR